MVHPSFISINSSARPGSVSDSFTTSPSGSSPDLRRKLATTQLIAVTEVMLCGGHKAPKIDYGLPPGWLQYPRSSRRFLCSIDPGCRLGWLLCVEIPPPKLPEKPDNNQLTLPYRQVPIPEKSSGSIVLSKAFITRSPLAAQNQKKVEHTIPVLHKLAHILHFEIPLLRLSLLHQKIQPDPADTPAP
jgi:hypothetical protein